MLCDEIFPSTASCTQWTWSHT